MATWTACQISAGGRGGSSKTSVRLPAKRKVVEGIGFVDLDLFAASGPVQMFVPLVWSAKFSLDAA
eukprot:1320719-Lingulodinium_polyedra.AAC.1